jgi:hypothetical protein
MAGLDPAIHLLRKRVAKSDRPRGQATREQKEKSRLSAGPSFALASFKFELPAALPVLIGLLTLTVGILLLAGLLAAALLLTGFLARFLILLARVLVLLTRVLVWAGHRGLPCLDQVADNAVSPRLVSTELPVPGELFCAGNLPQI